ncbi:hypothetical protein AXG93_3612s1160 [Marchantia polymorpha subsp. ruderalis]|uniref:Uncharacterized protein n=1 Tax=Marchantia polymorpha subsp. ruderalis TaxID=1480154 RepID=A0A176WCK0_MARPO|nr:hypothetical protein AXG93_3612s1160 [Marchantia polymorpha subsp. ruderalis]
MPTSVRESFTSSLVPRGISSLTGMPKKEVGYDVQPRGGPCISVTAGRRNSFLFRGQEIIFRQRLSEPELLTASATGHDRTGPWKRTVRAAGTEGMLDDLPSSISGGTMTPSNAGNVREEPCKYTGMNPDHATTTSPKYHTEIYALLDVW